MGIENCENCDHRYNDREDCFKDCVLTKLDNLQKSIDGYKEEVEELKKNPQYICGMTL